MDIHNVLEGSDQYGPKVASAPLNLMHSAFSLGPAMKKALTGKETVGEMFHDYVTDNPYVNTVATPFTIVADWMTDPTMMLMSLGIPGLGGIKSFSNALKSFTSPLRGEGWYLPRGGGLHTGLPKYFDKEKIAAAISGAEDYYKNEELLGQFDDLHKLQKFSGSQHGDWLRPILGEYGADMPDVEDFKRWRSDRALASNIGEAIKSYSRSEPVDDELMKSLEAIRRLTGDTRDPYVIAEDLSRGYAGQMYSAINAGYESSPEEIEKLYRKMAIKTSPYRNRGGVRGISGYDWASRILNKIDEAKNVLGNEGYRDLYDEYGSVANILSSKKRRSPLRSEYFGDKMVESLGLGYFE